MVKVAIAGGTGAVGRALAETLTQQNIHEAIILSRRESSNERAVLPTVQVDYDDLDSLTKVLTEHEAHTVICTFAITGTSLKKSQMNLIKASAAAPHCPACQVISGAQCFRHRHDEQCRSYSGTGDEMVTFTHTFDVARFLVAALDLDKWPRELRISGDVMTFKEFVKMAEEFKGVQFKVYHDPIDKLKKFEITELPSHEHLYSKFPKQRFQWFQSIFEQWTVAGLAHIQTEGSLNQTFTELKSLTIRDMLEQCWKSSQ
ncbi:NmrA-like family protein [Pestalotiopsis sp. NC0098]|nr:NmrA-like family protein [Pestalotiopsis sp. NC0098]